MAKPKVALIILNWNGVQDTLECLKTTSLSSKANIDLNTYVVDNGSTDNSVKKIKENFKNVKLVINKKNLGFSAGNNIGMQSAINDGHDYIVLLNNDTTVDKHTINRLVVGSKKNKFDLASPKIYFYPGREFHADSYQPSERGKVIWYAGGRIDWANVIPSHIGVDEVDFGQWNTPSCTDFATGCCMLIPREVTKKIGFLDTKYRAYFEDTDYSIRATKAGFTIGYIPNSFMWHKNAGSTGGSGSKKQTKLVASSRFTFAMRHASLRAKLALVKERFFANHKHKLPKTQ